MRGIDSWAVESTTGSDIALLSIATQTRGLNHLGPPVFFFLLFRRPLRSTLFPYTTLFRSVREVEGRQRRGRHRRLRFAGAGRDRKSTRLNSSHANNSYAVFCLKKTTRLLPRQHLTRVAPHLHRDLPTHARQRDPNHPQKPW